MTGTQSSIDSVAMILGTDGVQTRSPPEIAPVLYDVAIRLSGRASRFSCSSSMQYASEREIGSYAFDQCAPAGTSPPASENNLSMSALLCSLNEVY